MNLPNAPWAGESSTAGPTLARRGVVRRNDALLRSLFVIAGGLFALMALTLVHVAQGQADIGPRETVRAIIAADDSSAANIVRYIRLPRVVIGVVSGAALSIAGVLLQSVTRNPLAAPSTLGITSGAYLAVVIATVFAPHLARQAPLPLAFAGGALAALLAFSIAGGVRTTPTRLALAGVAVSLVAAAITATLQLLHEYAVGGLFLWGAGTLAQEGWSGTQYAWPRVVIGAVVALALARALDVLALGDDTARALGQRVVLVRSLSLFVAVFLAAAAVSVVGPIGFVGVVVPHLVRLMGVRGHRLVIVAAAVWGPVMLVAADVVARRYVSPIIEVPTGAVTALIGAPFFVWLARRSVGSGASPAAARTPPMPYARRAGVSPAVLLGLLGGLLIMLTVIGIMVGDVRVDPALLVRTLRGEGTALTERIIFDVRLPRLLVAALAGAALAVSGVLVQGVVRNPLAGPEIVGVTSGAGLGALVIMVLFPSSSPSVIAVAAFIGAFVAFGIVYLAAWQGAVAPERFALVGVAVSAFCSAGTSVLIVKAELRVAQALVWLSGSTYAGSWDDAARLAVGSALLLPFAWLIARPLDILGLGDHTAQSLGIPLERARLVILLIALGLAAITISTVGTIGFVGLVAPHAARLLLGTSSRHRWLIPVAALLGAIVVVAADVVGRFVLAPKEIPAGLVTTLLGAPYFLFLLRRSRRTT